MMGDMILGSSREAEGVVRPNLYLGPSWMSFHYCICQDRWTGVPFSLPENRVPHTSLQDRMQGPNQTVRSAMLDVPLVLLFYPFSAALL